jgi:predicted peroxiredoxin
LRLALAGTAVATACEGCPPLAGLLDRYAAAGSTFMVCPICFEAKQLDADALAANASLAGTAQLWAWIGESATTFSY